MKMSVTGGAPIAITHTAQLRGASWIDNGDIIFTADAAVGLSRVSLNGGEPELLTEPNRAENEKTHRYPEVLPEGDAVLFTLGRSDVATWDETSIAALRFETGEYRVLLEGASNPRYVSTGHLVYTRGNEIFAAVFDPKRLEIVGTPVPVLTGVTASRVSTVRRSSRSPEKARWSTRPESPMKANCKSCRSTGMEPQSRSTNRYVPSTV